MVGAARTARRRTPKNPTSRQVATWAGAAVAAGLVGYGAYRLNRARRGKFELPQPPQGTGQPVPLACELGPDYPGFEQDESGACVPTDATPPGYYVDVNCTDFVFVPGPGAQSQDLAQIISSLAVMTKDPTVRSADPTYNATQFLQKYWPNCPWPPVGGTPRLQQLFNALSLLLGREIVHSGGRVLGTATASYVEVDGRVAERLRQLGMPDYDPSVVPEILLPEYAEPDDEIGEEQPPPPPGPGPDLHEPEPTQGTIDLPPGGPVGPGDFPFEYPKYEFVPPKPPVLKHCQQVPFTKERGFMDIEDSSWAYDQSTLEARTHDFELFDFDIGDFSECKVWNLRFGLCLKTRGGALYGLLNPEQLDVLVGHTIHIRNTNDSSIDWSDFINPLWKRQYSAVIGLANTTGMAVADPKHTLHDPGVDPCPNDESNWPGPHGHHFMVRADHGNDQPRFREAKWQPRPWVSVVTSGRKVYARLHYFGMPRFYMVGTDPQWGGIDAPGEHDGDLIAVVADETAFEAAFKVWALGIS